MSALLAKINSVFDFQLMPRCAVNWYRMSGGDAADLDRLCQLVADKFASDLLDDFVGDWPFDVDETLKTKFRQRVVDYAHSKFVEITGNHHRT